MYGLERSFLVGRFIEKNIDQLTAKTMKTRQTLGLIALSMPSSAVLAESPAQSAIVAALPSLTLLFLLFLLAAIAWIYLKARNLYDKRDVLKSKYQELVTGVPPNIPDEYWKQAYEECEAGKFDKALWAKILYKHKGDEGKARIDYVMNRAKELDENRKMGEVGRVEKIRTEPEIPPVVFKEVNPADELAENVKILVNELKNLGCDIEFQYTEDGLIAYKLTTPAKKHHSGLANEWELAQILSEVI
jgi:hypothetical protein